MSFVCPEDCDALQIAKSVINEAKEYCGRIFAGKEKFNPLIMADILEAGLP